jgi:hypothetical protein
MKMNNQFNLFKKVQSPVQDKTSSFYWNFILGSSEKVLVFKLEYML